MTSRIWEYHYLRTRSVHNNADDLTEAGFPVQITLKDPIKIIDAAFLGSLVN